jgi:hypothetical protein
MWGHMRSSTIKPNILCPADSCLKTVFLVPFQARLLADLAIGAFTGEAFEGSTNGGLMQ